MPVKPGIAILHLHLRTITKMNKRSLKRVYSAHFGKANIFDTIVNSDPNFDSKSCQTRQAYKEINSNIDHKEKKLISTHLVQEISVL